MSEHDNPAGPPVSPLKKPLSAKWRKRLAQADKVVGESEKLSDGILIAELRSPAIKEIEGLEGQGRSDFARAFKIALCPSGDEENAMETALKLGFQEFLTFGMSDAELKARLKLAGVEAKRRWGRPRKKTGIRKSFFLGLPGQDAFLEWAHEACEQLDPESETGPYAALMVLDIDKFKRITAIYGLAANEIIVREICRRLRACIEEDTVKGHCGLAQLAMLARDEFGLFLTDLEKPEDAAICAEKLCVLFHEPFQINNSDVFVTASIGVAIAPSDANDAEVLFSRARSAMGHAKSIPSASFQFYSPAMAASEEERHQIENRLRRILEADELKLKYQPQVDIATDEIVGVEALIRWQDSTPGAMAPDAFMAIADEAGLMPEIGSWILEQSLKDAKIWHDNGCIVSVSVNVTPSMLMEPGFVDEVDRLVKKSGFQVDYLTLEVTESVFLSDRKKGAAILQELKDLGLCIALDDFGTGYSSMSYIKDLPLDYIKIDRAFIWNMDDETHGRAIVAAITEMAKTMDLGLVAEGVETEEQLAELKSLGLDHYQGYLCSVPVEADKIEALVKSRLNELYS